MEQRIIIADAQGIARGGPSGFGLVVVPALSPDLLANGTSRPGSFPVYAKPRNMARFPVVSSAVQYFGRRIEAVELSGCTPGDSFLLIGLDENERYEAGDRARVLSPCFSSAAAVQLLSSTIPNGNTAPMFEVGASALEHQLTFLSSSATPTDIDLWTRFDQSNIWVAFESVALEAAPLAVVDGEYTAFVQRRIPGRHFLATKRPGGALQVVMYANVLSEVG